MQVQKTEDGVIITNREMYETMQAIRQSMNRLEKNLDTGMAVLDEKVERAIQADERSREALNLANSAIQRTKGVHAIVEKIEKSQAWLWTTVVGVLLTSAIKALF